MACMALIVRMVHMVYLVNDSYGLWFIIDSEWLTGEKKQ